VGELSIAEVFGQISARRESPSRHRVSRGPDGQATRTHQWKLRCEYACDGEGKGE